MKRLFITVVTALSLAACGGASSETETTEATAAESAAAESTSGAEATSAEQGPLVPIGEAQVGDRSTCPVSGEEFVVSESSPSVEHEGRTYYFCCPGCAERFQADPARFLEQQGAPAAETEPSEG